jgi:hypothetical protein
MILDLPLVADGREQLAQEIEGYGISMSSLSRARLSTQSAWRSKKVHERALRRWLSLLMPYVCARLRMAFGCESNDDAAAVLCRHYARVCATDTHVDVYFDLAEFPLAIRFAGLDRDPGWVPAAGRSIAFHFD